MPAMVCGFSTGVSSAVATAGGPGTPDYTATSGTLTFNPVEGASTDPNLFQCFWSNGKAWGIYRQRRDGDNWTPEIEVLGGSLAGITVGAGA